MNNQRITLDNILSTGRPHFGHMGEHLRNRIQKLYGGTIDAVGNLMITHTGTPSQTLFAAHLDTVHETDGYVGFKRQGQIYCAVKECLGADDGAGIWLLLHMLDNNVPGTYVFTVGEEVGGFGATHFHIPKNIIRCIEFDRKGTDEIIWRQGWDDTGSLKAAKWLCNALQMEHKPSNRGLFTDNALWADRIPECLNVSIGYKNAHSPLETLDYSYLLRLSKAVLKVNWEAMPTDGRI